MDSVAAQTLNPTHSWSLNLRRRNWEACRRDHLATTTIDLCSPRPLRPHTSFTMAARAAAADLAKISNLGLGKNTLAQISAFRKRADDAKRQLAQLQQQKTDVDFAHYNKLIRNKDVVSQAQKILAEFKPVTYDVQAQLKAIDAFESKAVRICPSFRHFSLSPRPHRRFVASSHHRIRIASHSPNVPSHRIFRHKRASTRFRIGTPESEAPRRAHSPTRLLASHRRSRHLRPAAAVLCRRACTFTRALESAVVGSRMRGVRTAAIPPTAKIGSIDTQHTPSPPTPLQKLPSVGRSSTVLMRLSTRTALISVHSSCRADPHRHT